MPFTDELSPCTCGEHFIRVEGNIQPSEALNDVSPSFLICKAGHRRKICGVTTAQRFRRCPKCEEWLPVFGNLKNWASHCRNCGASLEGVEAVTRHKLCCYKPVAKHSRCVIHLKAMGITVVDPGPRQRIAEYVSAAKEAQAVASTIDILIDKVVDFPNMTELKADINRFWKKFQPQVEEFKAFDESYTWIYDLIFFYEEFTSLSDNQRLIKEAVAWLATLQSMRDREERKLEALRAQEEAERQSFTKEQVVKLMEQFVSDVAPVISTYVQDKDGREKIGKAIESARDRLRDSSKSVQKPKPARANTKHRGGPKRG